MTGAELTISESHLADVGGLHVHRSLPRRGRRMVGAWCFLDRFGPIDVTPERTMIVGPHPHIGLHTVTWLLSGEVLHSDSLGNQQPIRPGQLNLMTAGRGIVHAEDARGQSSGRMDGVQLWVAQPESTRHGPPAFAHHADLPRVELVHAQGDDSHRRVRRITVAGHRRFGTGRRRHRRERSSSRCPWTRLSNMRSPCSMGVCGLRTHGQSRTSSSTSEPVVKTSISCSVRDPGSSCSAVVPFGEEIAMWWNFVARDPTELTLAFTDWRDHAERFGPVDSSLARIEAPRPFWL